MIRKKILL